VGDFCGDYCSTTDFLVAVVLLLDFQQTNKEQVVFFYTKRLCLPPFSFAPMPLTLLDFR